MARIFLMGLIVLLGLPLPLAAGEISDIRVGKETQNDIEIIIEGDYGSYQGVGLRSPARFVVDLEGAHLKEGVSQSIKIEGPIVSGIKTAKRGNGLRVVLDSANKEDLFHCTMQDKEGQVVIKCWMPKEDTTVPIQGPEPRPSIASAPILPQKDLSELFGWTKEVKETEEKKETRKIATYTGEKITLDFYKTDLHNVFRLFSEISGKNMIIDDQVEGDLTLALKEVPWDSALDVILELKGLVKEEKLGTFIIRPKPEPVETGKGELVVKKFSEEILQPARLLRQEKENRRRAQETVLEAHNHESLGEKEEALALYEKAYAVWKDNVDLIMKTAYLHYTMGHFAKSYYFAGQALKLNPKNAEAALCAALSAARMDRQGEARQLFEAAIKGRPKIAEAFYNYGLFLKRQKDYGSALDIYQKYEQLFGPSLEVGLAIAGLYYEEERTTEACRKYKAIQKSGFPMDKNTEGFVRKKVRTLCNQGED